MFWWLIINYGENMDYPNGSFWKYSKKFTFVEYHKMRFILCNGNIWNLPWWKDQNKKKKWSILNIFKMDNPKLQKIDYGIFIS
jgi:hypothetical protein